MRLQVEALTRLVGPRGCFPTRHDGTCIALKMINEKEVMTRGTRIKCIAPAKSLRVASYAERTWFSASRTAVRIATTAVQIPLFFQLALYFLALIVLFFLLFRGVHRD